MRFLAYFCQIIKSNARHEERKNAQFFFFLLLDGYSPLNKSHDRLEIGKVSDYELFLSKLIEGSLKYFSF